METLQTYRIRKGLRQIDVANAIGYKQTSYQKIEVGKRIPKVSVIRKLAEFYDLPDSEIIDMVLEQQKHNERYTNGQFNTRGVRH